MDKQSLINLRNKIAKALTMPITRCTYKEIQNSITLAANGEQNTFVKLMDTLLTQKIALNLDVECENIIYDILDRYGISIVTAKEVHDKAEFINLLTSDLIHQPNALFFTNTIRRVDGKFLEFICDLDSLLHIIEHFTNRLDEFQKHDAEGKSLAQHKETIDRLQKKLKSL